MSFYQLERFRQDSPVWSGPRIVVLSAPDTDSLSEELNLLLASEDYHVLAFSAAQAIPTYFLEEPWMSTVVLQEKIDPNGTPAADDENGGAE